MYSCEEAKIIDLEGYSICPSFIDIFTNYGQPTNAKQSELASWNPALKIETNAIDHFRIDKKLSEK